MKVPETEQSPQQPSAMARLRDTLRRIYHGSGPRLVPLPAGDSRDRHRHHRVLHRDAAAPGNAASFLWLDYAVAALVALDMSARLLASNDMLRLMRQPTCWVDVFILMTLLFPTALANLGFLRILRLWSLSRSGALWRHFEMRGLKDHGARRARRWSTC